MNQGWRLHEIIECIYLHLRLCRHNRGSGISDLAHDSPARHNDIVAALNE